MSTMHHSRSANRVEARKRFNSTSSHGTQETPRREHTRGCGAGELGFTLTEILITIAIVAIISSIALPAYSSFIQRSRVPTALDALSSYLTRMEQRYQDVGNYANGANCAVALPLVSNFTVTCALTNVDQGFTATAIGSGAVAGYTYTITHQGTRNTTAHPKGLPATSCWTTRGRTCDT